MARRLPTSVVLRQGLSTKAQSPAALAILWRSDTESTSTVQLLSWGRGSAEQLGGGIEEIRFYPTPLASLLIPSDFRLSPTAGRLSPSSPPVIDVSVSCGLFHSSLLVDGELWIWDKGEGGRLGLGYESSAFTPTPNPNLNDVRSLVLGGIHSAALTRTGDIYT